MSFERAYKSGARHMVPAKVIKHVGRGRRYVTLQGKFVPWEKLVAEAWAEGAKARPVSSYPDGVVLTVAEFVELRRSGKI